uniref:hypothetical protein n=1 Tax=Candidatus Electronema sp. TaxID=2698783 RepID=UPI004055AF6C
MIAILVVLIICIVAALAAMQSSNWLLFRKGVDVGQGGIFHIILSVLFFFFFWLPVIGGVSVFCFMPQLKAAVYSFFSQLSGAAPDSPSSPLVSPVEPKLQTPVSPVVDIGQPNPLASTEPTLTPEKITPLENSDQHNNGKDNPQQESADVPPQLSSRPLVIEEPITPPLRPQRPPVIIESKRPVMITPSSPPKPRGKEGVASVQGEARQKNPAPKESDSCKSIKDTMDNMDRKMFLEIKKGVAPTNILINPINGNIYRVFPQSGQGNSRCGSYRIDATINGKNISCSETACD